MLGILSKAANVAGNTIDRVKSNWKKMPRSQKAETLTTIGLAAAAAFAKPKKSPLNIPVPQINSSVRIPTIEGGPPPSFGQFSLPPMVREVPESKFAKKMRKNFGR